MRGTTAVDVKENLYQSSPGKRGEAQLHDTRPCNTCPRGRIPIADTRKACATCRDRQKKYRQAKKQKSSAPTTLEKPNINAANTNNVPVTAALSAKRKVDKVGEEEGEEDMSEVLAKMAKRLKKQINRAGTSGSPSFPTRVKNSDPDYVEFQTATDMYKALKSRCKSKSLHFHGSFSIVKVPSVDNSKRERLVTQELRKIAKLSFEHDKPTLLGSALVYKCACTNHSQPLQPKPRTSLLNAIATGELAPQKRRQSDLAVWAGLNPRSTDPSPIICTGKILVSSEDDNSHPVGIEGQKITVKVEH